MPLVFNPQSFVGLVSWLVSILPELSPHQSERMVSDTFSTTSNVINEADGTNRPKSEIDRSLRQSIVHNNGVSEFDWLTHLDKGIWPPGDLFSEIKHSTVSDTFQEESSRSLRSWPCEPSTVKDVSDQSTNSLGQAPSGKQVNIVSRSDDSDIPSHQSSKTNFDSVLLQEHLVYWRWCNSGHRRSHPHENQEDSDECSDADEATSPCSLSSRASSFSSDEGQEWRGLGLFAVTGHRY